MNKADPTANGSIVLVDDEEDIRDTVGFALRREGYQVDVYPDGATAWETLEGAFENGARSAPQLAILDILMPRMDGLELCRRLRAVSEHLPIVFLTSKDEEFDRVLGLELGADDYLCKPFSMRELLARVKVLFRRLALSSTPAPADRLVQVGALEMDLDRYQARWRDTPLPLTVTEFLILCSLARRPGHVKTRQQLIEDGYPHDTYISERTIDSHIKRLRKKVMTAAPEFDAIETVYGLGYRYRELEAGSP
ncbi:MAG: response regulator transcription factor [Acidobacteriota bacterium]